jgi:Coenzyme PQQ synthesis protein D (PqqD)
MAEKQSNSRFDFDQGQWRKESSSRRWNGNPRHVEDLDISLSDDGYLIHRPQQDRITFLNSTAALILELCNGENSPDEIADLVKQAYGLPTAPLEDVRDALKHLRAEGLVQ